MTFVTKGNATCDKHDSTHQLSKLGVSHSPISQCL